MTSAVALSISPLIALNRYTAFSDRSEALTVIVWLVDNCTSSLYQVIAYLDVISTPSSLTNAVSLVESESVLNRTPFEDTIEPS